MKILVFSDSHGQLRYMAQAVSEEAPDMVFHLGDVAGDGAGLARQFPHLQVVQVRGNCDGMGAPYPAEREELAEGKRLWLLHGHTHGVKSGLERLTEEAQVRGVDAVFFGHTHVSHCEKVGSLWVVNPGTAQGWPNATCAVVKVEKDGVTCGLRTLR